MKPAAFVPPSLEVAQKIRTMYERRLTAEEFDAYVDAAMSEEEREAISELINWFQRRYPRPLDRLVSARRAYQRAARRSVPGAG